MHEQTQRDTAVRVPTEQVRRPFLSTHPAMAAAQREFARLSATLVQCAKDLRVPGFEPKTEVRLSPQRCILQFGHVAATIAWLKQGESVADGQLLVVVWRGTVAPTGAHQFERPETRRAAAATPVWEGSYIPEADSEATWTWQPQKAESPRCSSAELAAICAAELHRAYLDA